MFAGYYDSVLLCARKRIPVRSDSYAETSRRFCFSSISKIDREGKRRLFKCRNFRTRIKGSTFIIEKREKRECVRLPFNLPSIFMLVIIREDCIRSLTLFVLWLPAKTSQALVYVCLSTFALHVSKISIDTRSPFSSSLNWFSHMVQSEFNIIKYTRARQMQLEFIVI